MPVHLRLCTVVLFLPSWQAPPFPSCDTAPPRLSLLPAVHPTEYMAPEVYELIPVYNEKADIYR